MNYFFKWTDCGKSLCAESPTLAAAYFEASPGTMSKLRSRHIESWSDLGRTLYKGTWKSSTLACKFFQSSPALLEDLSFPEMERFAKFLDALSHRSYDLASDCLTLGQQLFPMIGDDRAAFISIGVNLVDSGWREIKAFFESGARALPRIEGTQRLRFLKLSEQLVQSGGMNIPSVMLETSNALAQVDTHDHERILGMAEALLPSSGAAVPEFIKACPQALDKLTMSQLEKWYAEGVSILRQNSDGGLAYFKIESARSEEMLETLSSGVEFQRVKDVMEMYCRGLAGAEIKLSESGELADKNIGWVSSEAPTTEGTTVFLPSLVDRYLTKLQNFNWFKVVPLIRLLGSNSGVSGSCLTGHPPCSRTCAMTSPARGPRQCPALENGHSPELGDEAIDRAYATDVQRFFDLFDDRKLALDITPSLKRLDLMLV